MKKAYKKPEIMFESFASSVALAGDCQTPTNTSGKDICGLQFGNVIVFLDGMSGCTFQVKTEGGDGAYNEICYHTPYGNNLFNS